MTFSSCARKSSPFWLPAPVVRPPSRSPHPLPMLAQAGRALVPRLDVFNGGGVGDHILWAAATALRLWRATRPTSRRGDRSAPQRARGSADLLYIRRTDRRPSRATNKMRRASRGAQQAWLSKSASARLMKRAANGACRRRSRASSEAGQASWYGPNFTAKPPRAAKPSTKPRSRLHTPRCRSRASCKSPIWKTAAK